MIDSAAVAGWRPGCPIAELSGETMGTTWRVKLAAPPATDLSAVHRDVATLLARLVAEMSHWDPDSLLCRFNRAPAGSWTTLPPAFATVIAAALEVASSSDGAFDPAAGRLVDLWGFGPVSAALPPGSAALEEARAVSGWHRLRFDAGARRLYQPGGVALDLSGIAKGYAVDALAGLLAARGLRHCLVEIGGELAGRGLKGDGEPWWVDLEAPPGVTVAPFRIALHQLAVATSGDYVRGRHTLDPRTGRPVEGIASVSVLHSRAMLGDAWATALTVLPPDRAHAIAVERRIACRWVRADGDEVLSPALAAMLEG